MADLSNESKEKLKQVIFERAYDIEQTLSEDNFFLARLVGLNPDQVEDASLKIAVKELKKEFNTNP